MKARIAIAILAVLCKGAGACAGEPPSPPSLDRTVEKALPEKTYGRVISAARSDPDKNGTSETIAITFREHKDGHPIGGEVIVLQSKNRELRPVWRHKGLNPWKLRVADVDGDGRQEIVVGVWKKSPKDPVMAKRVFVYSWNGERMAPKWLGSRLSRRFENFDVRDIDKDGRVELIALEVSPGKPRRVGIYRWRSFGFDWLGSAGPEKWEELTK